ncbi:hypothetical protein MTsDn1_15970 [Alteromonas sp. MTD1]|uniref:hypothetical protein n=1 Tax=Alteromonas sp. MTD1 TaxID=3057962 RepID=UPI0036F3F35A
MLKTLLTSIFAVMSFSTFAISLVEVSPVHFGSVSGQLGLSCSMSQFGVISGDCDATDTEISIGQIVVTNLPRNGLIEVILTGSSNTSLSYEPVAELIGAKSGTTFLYDNQPVYVRAKGNGADFTINVFGNITVQSNLNLRQPYTVDYTLQVNQQ